MSSRRNHLATAAFACLTSVVACSSGAGDPPSSNPPDPLGAGERIAQITNPTLPNHPKTNANVSITGATYLLTDKFDETQNGKSQGTVYLQDVLSNAPYSGVSLFSPTYFPASLALGSGDVVDLRGAYTEAASIGTATFTAGQFLVQISKPVVQFRFEGDPPTVGSATWAPKVINATDLDDYKKGLQWSSMLVTIENVTFLDNLSNDGNGRWTAHVTKGASVTMSNELFDLNAWNQTAPVKIAAGNTYKSITGVVTWFFNFHIAPRSPDDIVVQ